MNRTNCILDEMLCGVLAATLTVAISASVTFAQTAASPEISQATTPNATLPLTTKSPAAKHLAEKAFTLYLDRVEQMQAIELLRKAIAIDPDFAMAHELLAQISLNSGEQVEEQNRAYATRAHASAGEQEVIEWYQDVNNHNLISAITHMNDLLAQYPHDKTVVWMTTWWLYTQSQFGRSIEVYENSGITNSPGLMNNMGYNYASVRRFDKALAEMDKYVAAMPNDCNPLDSYAEILRMAGRFDQAIEHYRASLAINPQFYSSQFGIADTYSLMGDQARARREYQIGFHQFALAEQQRTLWKTREASTFVREGDIEWADRAFQSIADEAQKDHISLTEADTYRQMAMYQTDTGRAGMLLDKADAAVKLGEHSRKDALRQEAAQILRARVELAIKAGNAKSAKANLALLAAMADDESDKIISLAYQGAAGAQLFSEKKYAESIAHLEEDTNNPLSLKLLVAAYETTGDKEAAETASDLLSNLNDPTLEQALVVPAFRKCAQDSSCNSNVKTAAGTVPHGM
jgi:Tfp pilus assembly protein PilF